jgi:hypothetical protein
VSELLLRWGSYHWARNLWVLIIYLFFLPVMLPSVVPKLTTDSAVRVFPGVWKPLFLRLTSRDGAPTLPLFLSFCLLYFFLFPFKDNGLLFWVPVASAGIQKLFCGIYSAFKCSFDEFVGEKVVSPSYSSAILGLPPGVCLFLMFKIKRNPNLHFCDISIICIYVTQFAQIGTSQMFCKAFSSASQFSYPGPSAVLSRITKSILSPLTVPIFQPARQPGKC